MIEMNPTPAPIEEETDDIIILCSSEESQLRLEKCQSCEKFFIDDDTQSKCKDSGCNISLMISYKFKECPLEKW